jgi:hypothetical protein
MNAKQLISHIARMQRFPTGKEWNEIHSIAQDLTVRHVEHFIKGNAQFGSKPNNDRLGEQVHTYL